MSQQSDPISPVCRAGGEPRRGVRWWPAVAVVLVTGPALFLLLATESVNRQQRMAQAYVLVFCALVLLAVWLVFFSRMRRRTRGLVIAALLLLAASAAGTLRWRGVSGDVVPILEWRWSAARPSRAIAAEPSGAVDSIAPSVDFPQFLGPGRDGTIDGIRLARDWDAEPPRELWRRPVGAGWSGFSVVGDHAVTLEQRGDEEVVACYDLRTGEPRWARAEAVRFDEPISGPGPRSTPTIDGGTVFALGGTGLLRALRLTTGDTIWRRDVAADAGAPVPEYGVAASPLVTDGLVIVPGGGQPRKSLLAYGQEDGRPVWGGGDAPAAYASPLLARLAGRRQVLIFNKVGIVSHDPADGGELWRYPWPGETQQTSQPTLLPGDRLFVSSGYGVGGKMLRIAEGVDGPSASLVWESRSIKAKFTNVVHLQGFLYALDDGILTCVDASDGNRRWKGGRYGHGQLLLVGDLLIVMSERGDVVLVAATADEHRELGRFAALDGKTWNHPALAGKFLLVRNDREAACFELPVESREER